MIRRITFPKFTGIRCLMMPYIQGDPESVPTEFREGYEQILSDITIEPGKKGFLTIDESETIENKPHRGARSKHDRALHTEAGRLPHQYVWGSGGGWGSSHLVTLDRDVKILLANNQDNSCAIWNTEHENTSVDGDIGHFSKEYPYKDAIFMQAGEVHSIGILTPHESLPMPKSIKRQFLRILGSGVYGREPYFTQNPLLA